MAKSLVWRLTRVGLHFIFVRRSVCAVRQITVEALSDPFKGYCMTFTVNSCPEWGRLHFRLRQLIYASEKIYADGKGTSYAYTAAGRLSARKWARLTLPRLG